MATATMSLTSPNYFDEREHEGRRSIKSQYSHHLRSSSDSRQQQQQPQAGGGQPSSYPNHEIRVVDVTGDDDVFMGGPSSSAAAAAPHGAQPGPKLAVPSFAHHSRPSSEERTTTPVGPPPPSPPVSVDRLILADSPTDLTESPQRQPLELWDSHQSTPNEVEQPAAGPSSSAYRPLELQGMRSEVAARPTKGTPVLRRSMTSAEQSAASTPDLAYSSAIAPNLRGSSPKLRSSADDSLTTTPEKNANQSGDGFLQPPVLGLPTRRNTTGGSGRGAGRTRGTAAAATEGDETITPDGELASDIELQAEQIRRERERRRAAAQAEAERALTRAQSISEEKEKGAAVMGNVIREGHVNYVLMYNMLTGIRVAVSRTQAKMKAALTADDFSACQKYSFDIIGNELTPGAKHDFKFKDYAPAVFRALREDCFRLDPSDYLVSLTEKYILSELGSPGKSGSFFYFSRDYRFIIKTIHHSEHKFLRRVLKDYYSHVKENPHTLISRFYGLHRVKLPRGRKIHFVIMNNIFPPHKDVHETYDLKGSTVGREYPEDKAAGNPRAVLKDLNWINRNRELHFGPEKRALLTEQLRRDAALLAKMGVMDYSLLVGIHHVARGNRDNVRRNTLRVFSPDMPPPLRRAPTVAHGKGPASPEAAALRHTMRQSNPKALQDGAVMELEAADAGERAHCVFYADDGGLKATDEANLPVNDIYYLGVIDILTPYNTFKKLEHIWKGMKDDRHKISPVPPSEYSDRFFSFMKAIMSGGGGARSFLPEQHPS